MFISLSCEKDKTDKKEILATVNDRNIDLNEFRLFYELDPNFGIDSSGYDALSDELNKYIDMILAKSKAESEGLLKDSIFIRAIKWEQRQAMLRQLYRTQIENSIIISDQELRQEFQKQNISVNVRQIFSKDSEQIDEWYRQLNNGERFESLAQIAFTDTVLKNNGGNLGWMNLIDLDDAFGEAVINLQKNQISEPVKTQWGFHIIQLLDRKDNLILTESEYELKKKSLYKFIKRKKSKQLANQYIKNYIGKLNPQPNGETFHNLWRALIPKSEVEKSHVSFKINFTNDLVKTTISRYQAFLQDPLIEYKGGNITLKEYLDAVYEIPIGNRPTFQSPKELSNQIGVWVRDELLLENAKMLDLDEHEKVTEEVQKYIEEQSYYYYLQNEINNMSIPNSIIEYFDAPIKERQKYSKKLNKHHTIEEWKGWKAEKVLHLKLINIPQNIKIDSAMLQNESNKIDWDRRIRLFMVRKPS
ncbi:MAG: peptidylprolyl isomerase [Calditrichia bacterium]|nr:peptidylprolyl isomerase [Calditrichia bacterium]